MSEVRPLAELKDALIALESNIDNSFQSISLSLSPHGNNKYVKGAAELIREAKNKAVIINSECIQWRVIHDFTTGLQLFASLVAQLELENFESFFPKLIALCELIMRNCLIVFDMMKTAIKAMERLTKRIDEVDATECETMISMWTNKAERHSQKAKTWRSVATLLEPILIGYILAIPAEHHRQKEIDVLEGKACWEEAVFVLRCQIRPRIAMAAEKYLGIRNTVFKIHGDLNLFKEHRKLNKELGLFIEDDLEALKISANRIDTTISAVKERLAVEDAIDLGPESPD